MIEQSLRRVGLQWAARDLEAMRNVYQARSERGATERDLADLREMLRRAEERYRALAAELEMTAPTPAGREVTR